MELTIDNPDGFAPTKVDYELPNGLTKDQVENPLIPRWGKVNCQHSSWHRRNVIDQCSLSLARPFSTIRLRTECSARLQLMRNLRLAPRVGFEPTACRLTAEQPI